MNSLDKKWDAALDDAFDRRLDELIEAHRELHFADDGVTNYKAVTPEAKAKLKGLLKHYAKKPHPFTACVRDNRKRFGPRAEQVCAVLKDLIRGTTKWRGKGNPMDRGTAGLSEIVEMDEATADLIERLAELDLWELLGLAQFEDDNDVKLDYPIEYQRPQPTVTESDTKFLSDLRDHHSARLKMASKYATNPECHPDIVNFATDAVSESTRQIARINRMLKTGRPY